LAFWAENALKIGPLTTAHNIMLMVDGIWSWNRDRANGLPGGKQIYIRNKFTSKAG